MKKISNNILLVEDNTIIAIDQKMQLEKRGYTVYHILNGEKSVEFIKTTNQNINLILMDIDLGKGIDGTLAAREILKIKEVPVVFLSSHTEPEIVEKTESITSYGYVVKNSGITVLDASIKMAFKLFDAHQDILLHKINAEKANNDLNLINMNLENVNKTLKRLDRAIENTKDIVFITNTEGTIIYINSQFTKIYGYTKEEILGKENPRILSKRIFTDEENRDFWNFLKNKHHLQTQFTNKTKDGEIITVETSIDPIFDDNGTLVEFVQIHRDITERNCFERNYIQLYSNVNTMQSIFDNFEEAIWAVDKDFNFTFINSYFAEDFKKGLNLEIKQGMHAFSNIPPEFKKIWKPKYEEALKGNRISFEFEEAAFREKKYFRVNLNPIHQDNHITGVSAVSVDITKQKIEMLEEQKKVKNSQDKIKELLAEKEIILKEVHHRIKNNMTTLIALIALQSDSTNLKETKNALSEIENRITTMMVLYETLYQSTDFQHASARLYLSALIDNIMANFPNSKTIIVNKNISDLQIDAKRIFNLGIVINELITNIMKYAFKDSSRGQIDFSVIIKNSNMVLSLADNGIGLPSDIDLDNNPGFGMKLIKMLVDQMEGDIQIERTNGTKFIISCKLEQE